MTQEPVVSMDRRHEKLLVQFLAMSLLLAPPAPFYYRADLSAGRRAIGDLVGGCASELNRYLRTLRISKVILPRTYDNSCQNWCHLHSLKLRIPILDEFQNIFQCELFLLNGSAVPINRD